MRSYTVATGRRRQPGGQNAACRVHVYADHPALLAWHFLSGRVDAHDRAFLTDLPGPLAPLMGVRVDEPLSTAILRIQ